MNKRIHTISLIVENKKGVLNKVTSIIRRRQYNIQTITAGPIEKNNVTRINIVIESEKGITQVINQLNKIIEVVKIFEIDSSQAISRELLLMTLDINENDNDVINLLNKYDCKTIDRDSNSLTLQLSLEPYQVEEIIELTNSANLNIKRFSRSGVVSIKKNSYA